MLSLHDTSSDRVAQVRRSSRASRKTTDDAALRFSPALAEPSRVIFLDVETTGLSWYYDELTMVGWARGGVYNVLLAGEDDPGELLEALETSAALVTFNGTQFDLRFLRKVFGELHLPPVHIDLRYLARRAGFSGGQKAIERALGLNIREGIEDVDGAAAVTLWHRYLRGDTNSLNRLIDYNRSDVVGMCGILDEMLDRLETHADLLFSRPRFEEIARHSIKGRGRDRRAVAPTVGIGSTFEMLFRSSLARNATIVGVDLTGSEARPSGFCTLRGSDAETLLVRSDEEILSKILAERPAIVSIDSPLSLPFGRTAVDDADPARDEFGIMRQCERELKRRGINVYPCLLPSMQGLTKRGIRLARQIRAAGIPVIESYPGAAQDIMRIPRKGAGLEFLKQGLADFGISGPFTSDNVTHDELDAITSALVGTFFLAGKFEPLQGPSEGALIIPDLNVARPKVMVIGISGRICAGKTTIARILEQRGFAYTRFSQVLDNLIIARGQIPDRDKRQLVGMEINASEGQQWLAEKVLEHVEGKEFIVIDGLRFPEDHAFFAERFGSDFFHIHIKASDDVRASRYAAIGNGDFEIADSQPVEAKVDKLAALAAVTIENDASIDLLSKRVLDSIRKAYKDRNVACLSRLS